MSNYPGESLVLQTDFLYMVERVHICIDYLKSHVHLSPHPLLPHLHISFPRLNCLFQQHFREAEIYPLRFQQCMTRAMTLIKMYFVGSLRALTADVFRRISEKVGSQVHVPSSQSIRCSCNVSFFSVPVIWTFPLILVGRVTPCVWSRLSWCIMKSYSKMQPCCSTR